MPLLVWDAKYSVGVTAMDAQHTVLFEILNQLYDAMTARQDRAVLGDLLTRLSNFAHQHFAEEEQMMAAAQYPELEPHRVLHRDLLEKVEDFKLRLNRKELTISLHLLNFLRDCLTRHIQQVDHNYSAWMNERGIV